MKYYNQDLFKQQCQIAIQSSIISAGDTYLQEFIDWHNKTRKHILFSEAETDGLDPIGLSASLCHHVSMWSDYTPVLDPITLLKYGADIDPTKTQVVYVYDLHLLGIIPEYSVHEFISYAKYLLMNTIRLVMAVPCGMKVEELDIFFRNKKVASMFIKEFSNKKYCKVKEV